MRKIVGRRISRKQPESFRMALKEMVEKEIADDEIEVKVNDGTNHVKGKINKRNTKYMQDRRSSANVSNRRWRVVKIAVAALVLGRRFLAEESML